MPLPHYTYLFKEYKRMKRKESIARLFSDFVAKKYTEDGYKHSR